MKNVGRDILIYTLQLTPNPASVERAPCLGTCALSTAPDRPVAPP